MKISRKPRKNLRLVKNCQRRLKGRGPINRSGGQTDLSSSPMIATALLAELGSDSKRMKVEREKDNSEEKDRPDQPAGFESFFHKGKRPSILLSE